MPEIDGIMAGFGSSSHDTSDSEDRLEPDPLSRMPADSPPPRQAPPPSSASGLLARVPDQQRTPSNVHDFKSQPEFQNRVRSQTT